MNFDVIKVIILGIVEGLTEFAPISSTGHQILVDDMWLKTITFLDNKETVNTFKIVIQLGSILAAAWIFRVKFKEMIFLQNDLNRNKNKLSLKHLFIGLIPAGILGFLFDDFIDKYLFSVPTVLIGLVLGAILMIFADYKSKSINIKKSIDEITHRDALLIGCFQCLALWPGFSRSGSTISAGVLLKYDYKASSDFTFMMAVPIMLAASLKSLLSNYSYIDNNNYLYFLIGFITAFVFGIISIRLFLVLINKVRLIPFAIYRIILALIISIIYFM